MSKTKRSEFDPITALPVYVPGADGGNTVCIGRLLLRGRQGVEAFDVHDKPIGLFFNQKSAAGALLEIVT
jgi:hypothetical protein